jgi:hypothetical protein
VVIPAAYDQDTKQPLFDFSLLNSGGGRSFDTNSIIQRYEQRILMTVLADFIMVGHEGTGSYALHTDKTGLFRASINSVSQAIADVLNRYAVPRLFAVNGWKVKELPQFVPGDVDPPDLNQLSTFMGQMSQAGVQWFPDPELEKFLRQAARLPKMDETTEELREQQKKQADVMAMAQQEMQMIQLKQQAEQGAHQMEQAAMQTEQQKMGLAQQEMGVQQQAEQMQQSPQEEQQGPDLSGHQVAQEDLKVQGGEQQLRHKEELHQAKLKSMVERAKKGTTK